MNRIILVTAATVGILTGLAAPHAWAVAAEEFGNKPLSEQNYAAWKGILPLVNDKARVYLRWSNGRQQLWYLGKSKDVNAALAQFVKVAMERHVVVLRLGPAVGRSFDKQEVPHNWELHVPGGIAATRVTDDIESQKDPVLTIYIGGDIDLDKLEIPRNVTLRSALAGMRSDDSQDQTDLQKRIADFVERSNSDANDAPIELHAVAKALQPILETLGPKAKIEYRDKSLFVTFLPQSFKIHGRAKSGRINEQAHDEIGPSYQGFVLKAHLQPRGEVNQAEVPQTIQEPYWLTGLDVTPIAETDKQVYWALLYGSQMDQKLLDKIRGKLKALKD